MIFGDIIKVLIRNIHAYKGIYSRSLSGTLEMDFVAGKNTKDF